MSIQANGYRSEQFSMKVGNEDVKKVILVPSKPHAFVSKRDGTYDLYKAQIDGKNEEKILEGTGNERGDNISLLANTDKNIVAYVSTRTDQRTKDGQAIDSLNIINLDDNSIQKVTDSERIQLIDFVGNRLVYVKIQQGLADDNKTRNRIISYDLDSLKEQELASTNTFNDVISVKGIIYYAPAEYKANGGVGLYKINPDGTGKGTIFGKEAYNLFRADFDKINVAVGNDWYQYDTNSAQLNKLNGAPASQQSRLYTLSPDNKKAAWVDQRDGKGVLIVYDIDTGEEKVIQRQSGLSNPIVWLNNEDLIYRISNNSETADYAVSVSGGEPKKIQDVTNTVSLDRFYYY